MSQVSTGLIEDKSVFQSIDYIRAIAGGDDCIEDGYSAFSSRIINAQSGLGCSEQPREAAGNVVEETRYFIT